MDEEAAAGSESGQASQTEPRVTATTGASRPGDAPTFCQACARASIASCSSLDRITVEFIRHESIRMLAGGLLAGAGAAVRRWEPEATFADIRVHDILNLAAYACALAVPAHALNHVIMTVIVRCCTGRYLARLGYHLTSLDGPLGHLAWVLTLWTTYTRALHVPAHENVARACGTLLVFHVLRAVQHILLRATMSSVLQRSFRTRVDRVLFQLRALLALTHPLTVAQRMATIRRMPSRQRAAVPLSDDPILYSDGGAAQTSDPDLDWQSVEHEPFHQSLSKLQGSEFRVFDDAGRLQRVTRTDDLRRVARATFTKLRGLDAQLSSSEHADEREVAWPTFAHHIQQRLKEKARQSEQREAASAAIFHASTAVGQSPASIPVFPAAAAGGALEETQMQDASGALEEGGPLPGIPEVASASNSDVSAAEVGLVFDAGSQGRSQQPVSDGRHVARSRRMLSKHLGSGSMERFVSRRASAGYSTAGSTPLLPVASDTGECIDISSFHAQVGTDVAEALWPIFDIGSTGFVTRFEIIRGFELILTEWRALRGSLRGQQSISSAIRWFSDGVLYFMAFLAFLLIFQVDVVNIFVAIGAVLVPISFAVQGALGNAAASVTFIVGHRCYDVGDWVGISGIDIPAGDFLRVDDVSLFTTTFTSIPGRQIQLANYIIAGLPIQNHSRTQHATFVLVYQVGVHTSTQRFNEFARRVLAFMKSKPLEWRTDLAVYCNTVDQERGVMELELWATHQLGWSEIDRIWASQSELVLIIAEIMSALDIQFRKPTQPVVFHSTLHAGVHATVHALDPRSAAEPDTTADGGGANSSDDA